MDIVQDTRRINANIDYLASVIRGVTDAVLVAPLSVFDGLCKQGVFPLRVQLYKGVQSLQRFTGLHVVKEPL